MAGQLAARAELQEVTCCSGDKSSEKDFRKHLADRRKKPQASVSAKKQGALSTKSQLSQA